MIMPLMNSFKQWSAMHRSQRERSTISRDAFFDVTMAPQMHL